MPRMRSARSRGPCRRTVGRPGDVRSLLWTLPHALLEGRGHSDDASVQLRDRDVHRHVQRRQSALRLAPALHGERGVHGLQLRDTEAVEHLDGPLALVAIVHGRRAHGEGHGVHHGVHGGYAVLDEVPERRRDTVLVGLVLQRVGVDRQHVRAERLAGLHQRVDEVRVTGEPVGTVERHADGRAGGIGQLAPVLDAPGGYARVIDPGARLLHRQVVADAGGQQVVAEEVQALAVVLQAAQLQVGPCALGDRLPRVRVRRQLGIEVVDAGHRDEPRALLLHDARQARKAG